MANNWMNQVIINTLNGNSQAVIKNLTDKQLTVFLKYFTKTNSSKNTYSYEYISEDKRYYAYINNICGRYTMSCKDYKLLDIERLQKAIKLTQKELETGFECKYDINLDTKQEYIKIRKYILNNEEIEEDKEDLERYIKELKKLGA